MGTGPFKFVEYVPNTRVVLEKNPDYWEEGLPYLDGIEMTIASEDTSRTTAVVTGTVDFIEYAPLRDIDDLRAEPGHHPGRRLQHQHSLHRAEPEPRAIRQACRCARRSPWSSTATRMLGPTVVRPRHATAVLFPPDYWAALQQEVPAPDIEGAKALMAEAGFADGFSTTITSWSQYSFLSNAAVVLQEQLRQIGIEAELNLVENATMIEQVYTEQGLTTSRSRATAPTSIRTR